MSYSWHRKLISAVNKGYIRNNGKLIFNKEAISHILSKPVRLSPVITRTSSIFVSIPPYQDKDAPVFLPSLQLSIESIKNDLLAVIVHGSAGDGSMTVFSDIDALVIIKDEVFEDPKRIKRAVEFLRKSLQKFYRFDPLQHHGWFILAEHQLNDYPQTYLPLEAIAKGKCVFPEQGYTASVKLNIGRQNNFTALFYSLADSIINKSKQNNIKNLYRLKGFLSQAMLLPALYCQARDLKCVYKSESFELARVDFSNNVWSIMDEVSQIRERWHYKLSPWRYWLLIQINPYLHRFRSYFAPTIVTELQKQLDDDFFNRMINLVNEMRDKLKNNEIY